MKKTKILFVCKHNLFRSRIAEAYFKKINKNKGIVATSAGVIRGYSKPNRNVVIVAKEFGLNIKGKAKGLSIDLLKEQNFIIITADDVPNIFDRKEYIDFKKTKVIVWKIPDNPEATSFDKMRTIIRDIKTKVDELNSSLQKKK